MQLERIRETYAEKFKEFGFDETLAIDLAKQEIHNAISTHRTPFAFLELKIARSIVHGNDYPPKAVNVYDWYFETITKIGFIPTVADNFAKTIVSNFTHNRTLTQWLIGLVRARLEQKQPHLFCNDFFPIPNSNVLGKHIKVNKQTREQNKNKYYDDLTDEIRNIITNEKMKTVLGIKSDSDMIILFHGTTMNSAYKIVKKINLARGSSFSDFSDGQAFYVTRTLPIAIDYAHRFRDSSGPAVLLFCIKKTVLYEKYRCLNLYESQSKWNKIVKYYRVNCDENEDPRGYGKKLKQYDLIRGPMSIIVDNQIQGWHSEPHYSDNTDIIGTKENGGIWGLGEQIAIKSDKLAKELDKCLKLIFYMKE